MPNAVILGRVNQTDPLPIRADCSSSRVWYLVVAFPLLAAILFHLTYLPRVVAPQLFLYDEGVNFYFAEAAYRGEIKPYHDVYLVHPPGLLWLNMTGLSMGLGLVSQRFVCWVATLAVGWLVYRLTLRAVNSSPRFAVAPFAALGVCLLFSSERVLGNTCQVLSHLPVLILSLAALSCLSSSRRGAPIIAGLLIAIATMFRLQAVFYLPSLAVFALLTYGLRAGIRASLLMGLAAAGGGLLFHGTLALLEPQYLDQIVFFHGRREKTGLYDRMVVFRSVFEELPFAAGLIGSTLLLAGGQSIARGIGGFALANTVITVVGARFLLPEYFIESIPFLALATVVSLAQMRTPHPLRLVVLFTLLILALQGPIAFREVAQTKRNTQRDEAVLDRVRQLPGTTLATMNPKIAIWSGRRLPPDRFNPDIFPAIVYEDVPDWFERNLLQVDAVLITESNIPYLTVGNHDALVRSGKPVAFATDYDKADYVKKFGALPPGAASRVAAP